MPERDYIWWPRTGICLTAHRDACAKALRVQTPLNIDMWHAMYIHVELFDVVCRVANRMACVATRYTREYSAVPTVTVYRTTQMAGLAGIARLYPYDVPAQLVLE